ncbi:tRNA uracil 4-sulfurtransferase ThiI [Streptomyces qinglanensis]|uniref:tRNA uracil 4-sulfurtransferase ThiI n=1 Tax=Streptomyces qinglanensis TaxID=943816 RepID=UPI003D703EAA
MPGIPHVPAPRSPLATEDATEPTAGSPCILLKHGEVFLKGGNRHLFTQRLHDNLRHALRGVGGSTWISPGRNVTVLGGEVPRDVLLERARRVIGFNVVEPAVRMPSTEEDITAAVVAALDEARTERPGLSFAVRVKRRHKGFPLTGTEFAQVLGARAQRALDGLRVNLKHPDVQIMVEIEKRVSYVSRQRLPGLSGLPVGSSGRALALLSGGYDSPVAAHRAMRRGLRCDFVHFTGAPYTNPASLYKAYALARELNRYQPGGKLYVVALGKAQKQLAIAGADRLQVVAQRRLMVRAAAALARRSRAEALVTGDSLGQVASQTVANMAAVDEAATLPVLRPLLGWEKQEIIDEARTLGTAGVSVLPDEDCCRLLAPPRVTTRASVGDLRAVERRLDLDEVVEGLLREVQVLCPGEDDTAAVSGTGTGVAQPPGGAGEPSGTAVGSGCSTSLPGQPGPG